MADQKKVTGNIARVAGMRYGRLVVLGPGLRSSSGRYRWRCMCDCGEVIDVRLNNLTAGRTRSCGCLNREQNQVKMTKINLNQ